MMMPVGRLVLLRSVDKRDLVSATSWLLVPALVGPILGPPVGGFIVTYLDWRWIFYINVPIGILGIGLVLAFIENVKSDTREPFDIVGFILSGIALACLLFGFELSSHEGPAVFLALALVAMGLITGTLYVFHARRHPAPILDLSLMRVPTYSLALVAGSLSRVTQGAQPFLLPLMMQIGFGLSAAQSGLLTFATACGSMLMKGAAAGILRRFGFRTTLIWNSLFSSALYALCAAFRPDWPHWAIYAVLLVCGFSMSLQFTAFNTVAYDDIPSRRMSAATSFYTTFQQMMLSLGICIGALILHASSRIAGHGQPTLDDFSVAFLVVTAVSLAASPVSALFPADAGAVMSGHKARRSGDAET